jgi:predicted nucleic-acid-binding Zn-ribbon protein
VYPSLHGDEIVNLVEQAERELVEGSEARARSLLWTALGSSPSLEDTRRAIAMIERMEGEDAEKLLARARSRLRALEAVGEQERAPSDASPENLLGRRFVCARCGEKGARVETLRLSGTWLETGRHRYVFASCRSCGYTETYDLRALQGRDSAFFDMLFG